MKHVLSAIILGLALSACSTPPHPRTPSSVTIDSPVMAHIPVTITSIKRIQPDSTDAFDGEIEAYDADGRLRLDIRGGDRVTIYLYVSSSAVWGGKKFLTESEGKTIADLLTTTNVKGCKVDLVFDHDGNLTSVKGNCDPMASANGDNETT